MSLPSLGPPSNPALPSSPAPGTITGGTIDTPSKSNNDGVRFAFGIAAFVLAFIMFAVAACWAAVSIDAYADTARAHAAAVEMAIKAKVALPTSPIGPGWALAAKATLVATIGGFGVALLRLGERLTMPLTLYLQMVEHQSKKGSTEQSAGDLLDLLRKLMELGSKIPPGGGA